MGLQDKETVEDLLIAGADVNYAPAGLESPLCVALRHCMGSIAKTLLTYKAHVPVPGHPLNGSLDEEGNPMGPTLTELAQMIECYMVC